MTKKSIEELANKLSQTSKGSVPNARAKAVIDRIVLDLMLMIEDLDIQPEEFWTAINQLAAFGVSNEFGLLVAGLGLEHYFDVRLDEQEEAAGMEPNGTPRTIEGPLYIAGAPVSAGKARLDDGSDLTELLYMDGQILDVDGQAIPGALVEVWHCNSLGNYSFFDKTQSSFNLRRSIIADDEGRYSFQSIMPSGYGVPPDGETQKVLDLLGRHGQRPAHIHFMISAPGYRQLTTQINIKGDPYTYDDFAFATRDELIADVEHQEKPTATGGTGPDRPYATIHFNFTLPHAISGVPSELVERPRAHAA